MVVSPVQASAHSSSTISQAAALKDIFAVIDAASCPESYNFHMHTVCSDGRLTLNALMEQVISLGLKGFAITDHHTVAGYHQALQWLEDWQWSHPAQVTYRKGQPAIREALPQIFTGVEITASLANTEVHILGYGFNPNHWAIQPYLQGHAPTREERLADRVIRAIQRAHGLAVLAHPARYRTDPEVLIPQAAEMGIDGVETYYAYDNPSSWRPCPKKTPMVKRLAESLDLLSTCGTDTHGLNLTRRL